MHLAAIEETLRLALREDLGGGDVTTDSVVPATANARARVLMKQDGVLAGLPAFFRVFEILDGSVRCTSLREDGAAVKSGDVVAEVEGSARTLLSGERTALNLLQRLSGIATATAAVVALLGDSRIKLLDTRKTTPGLRALEKYAVRMGGGHNHRLGLFDAVMIKNNHLKFASPRDAVARARAHAPVTATVEIEIENFDQLREALTAGPDIIMLDNMTSDRMREALDIIAGRARVEISGNVTKADIPRLRDLGVDYISMGALTHSAPALDISLRIEPL